MLETYSDLQRFIQQLNLCSVDFARLCEIVIMLAIVVNCVREHLENIALVVEHCFFDRNAGVVKIFAGNRAQLLSRFQAV